MSLEAVLCTSGLWLLSLAGVVPLAHACGRAKGIQEARRKAAEKAPEPLKMPVCGCGHNLALHELSEGRCYATKKFGGWELPSFDGPRMAYTEPTEARCGCRRYVGPDHPSMYLSSPTQQFDTDTFIRQLGERQPIEDAFLRELEKRYGPNPHGGLR